MPGILHLHFNNTKASFEIHSYNHNMERIFCICGGKGEERSGIIKDIFQSSKNHNLGIYFTDDSGEKIHPKMLIAQTRNQYVKKHNHEGLFFQQRFQSAYADMGETVRESLDGAQKNHSYPAFSELLTELQIYSLLEKPLIQLSSGEWQRYTFCLNIIKNPEILLFEDGLKGLDKDWRSKIVGLFLSDTITTPLLIFSSENRLDEIPSGHYIFLTTSESREHNSSIDIPENIKKALLNHQPSFADRDVIIDMKGVNIRYGSNVVLDNILWEVRRSEKWKVLGHNGAGKSTLLSLVYGDNPQAYSQPVYLFGQRKGNGQSIWELKSRISYFSSDLLQYYRSTKSGFEVILSEVKTPHMNTQLPPKDLIKEVAVFFGIEEFLNVPFSRLKPGIRRQLLLIASYLKSSELIILDEPYHGFDNDRIHRNNRFIEFIVSQTHRTLLFVSHILQYFPKGMERSIMLKKGRIEAIKEVPEGSDVK